MDLDICLIKLNQFFMEKKIVEPQYKNAVAMWSKVHEYNQSIRPPFIIRPWDLNDPERSHLSLLLVAPKRLFKIMIRPDGYINSIFVNEDSNNEKLFDCNSPVQVFEVFKTYLAQLSKKEES